MANAKWIGGFFGLLSGGPIGALAGFVLGALFDAMDTRGVEPMGGTYTGQSQETINQGTRNGFLFSMLTLASYVIKADGKIMHSEMELVRQFLRQNFGQQAVQQGEDIMRRLFDRQKQMEAGQPGSYRQTIADCCRQLADILPEAQRLQMLSFLTAIAKADGTVHASEIQALREITSLLGLSEANLNSMLNLGATTLSEAYKVLEVEPTATDDEVKAAYKRLVVKNHPDRVASLGEDIRRAAEEKMRKINEAKELIYKARGI